MTTSDFSSTHSAIAAAAYASKISYTSIDGAFTNYSTYVAEGNLAPFSSHGPAADSATKPDIAAPGLILGSGINSYDTTYNIGGANRAEVIGCYTSPINGRNYCYAMMMGTSMASPMTSGIVALMLEADPNLTPDLVKYLICSTAITDSHTGTIPVEGSNLWGFGKINAYAAVKKAWQTVNIDNLSGNTMNYMIYPNPNCGSFGIDYNSIINDAVNIEIFDLCGKLVYSDKWDVASGYNKKKIDISEVGKGIYFTKISSRKWMSVYKMAVE
jgi:minor extracellular serine protease Vpr